MKTKLVRHTVSVSLEVYDYYFIKMMSEGKLPSLTEGGTKPEMIRQLISFAYMEDEKVIEQYEKYLKEIVEEKVAAGEWVERTK